MQVLRRQHLFFLLPVEYCLHRMFSYQMDILSMNKRINPVLEQKSESDVGRKECEI